MRDHKSHLKKWSLKRGLLYLVGNQEATPKALVPEIRQTPFERPFFEVTLVVSHKRDYCISFILTL